VFIFTVLLIAGMPLTEQPNAQERFPKKSHIPADLSLQQLEDFVVQLYPQITQLSRVGFSFVKSTKSRQLVPVNGATVSEMRVELKRSRLFILPRRDLLPLVHVCPLTLYDIILHVNEHFSRVCLNVLGHGLYYAAEYCISLNMLRKA